MEENEESRDASSYTARLDLTLQALQDRLEEHQAMLETVSTSRKRD